MADNNINTFPAAYSSFALNVDSRDAERNANPPTYVSGAGDSGPTSGILRHSSRPQAASHSATEKRRDVSPKSHDRSKYGVRFSTDVTNRSPELGSHPLHHRRSSTAAFLEYIRAHLPEAQHRAPLALTPKRVMLLFAVVFSATYMALSLFPLMAGVTGFAAPMTVVVKRGDGYYGNSHIFRGGESLGDPHHSGDEHGYNHYAAQANEARQANRRINSEEQRSRRQRLKSSTLAEQASLDEMRAQRARAREEALERAHMLELEDPYSDSVSDINLDDDIYVPERRVRQYRRPPSPEKKAARRVEIKNEPASNSLRREDMATEDDENSGVDAEIHESDASPAVSKVAAESVHTLPEELEDEQDLEATIARLRQEALDRRMKKKQQLANIKKAGIAHNQQAVKPEAGAKLAMQDSRPLLAGKPLAGIVRNKRPERHAEAAL